MRRTSVAFSFFTTLVLRVNYCSALFSVALLFGLLKGFSNGIVDVIHIHYFNANISLKIPCNNCILWDFARVAATKDQFS